MHVEPDIMYICREMQYVYMYSYVMLCNVMYIVACVEERSSTVVLCMVGHWYLFTAGRYHTSSAILCHHKDLLGTKTMLARPLDKHSCFGPLGCSTITLRVFFHRPWLKALLVPMLLANAWHGNKAGSSVQMFVGAIPGTQCAKKKCKCRLVIESCLVNELRYS